MFKIVILILYKSGQLKPRSFRLLAACVLTLMSGIAAAQSSGTAFVVAPGLLVTNHHVIEGCGVTLEICR